MTLICLRSLRRCDNDPDLLEVASGAVTITPNPPEVASGVVKMARNYLRSLQDCDNNPNLLEIASDVVTMTLTCFRSVL